MYPSISVLTILTLLSLWPTSLAQSVQPCPLFGPVFPAPSNPSNSRAIKAATKSANNAIQAALLNATAYGQLDPNSTSFSIDVYSTHENGSIFTYHYSAPALAHPTEGVARVDSNTIYRIGSVLKLLTVYTYLIAAGGVSFNEPVTNYIPELAAYAKKNAAALKTSHIDVFDWNDITVGALASHMAGIAREFAPNLASEVALIQLLGPVPDVNVKFCGNPAQRQLPCNRSGESVLVILFLVRRALRHAIAASILNLIYAPKWTRLQHPPYFLLIPFTGRVDAAAVLYPSPPAALPHTGSIHKTLANPSSSLLL
jgi:Beta-lactamase